MVRRDVLEVVQLGLGADGRTASLVPGAPVLDVADRDVADRDVAMTGTYAGSRSATGLAGRVRGADAVLLADADAAADLASRSTTSAGSMTTTT